MNTPELNPVAVETDLRLHAMEHETEVPSLFEVTLGPDDSRRTFSSWALSKEEAIADAVRKYRVLRGPIEGGNA